MSPRRKKSRKRPSKPPAKAHSGAARKLASSRRDAIAGQWFGKLVALQARLRAPGGCPWDREQTHESLRKFLVEETYEVLDAMESGNPHKFSSELGDLLLQVVFHAVLAEERGQFTISDVIESVHTKMVRRHPHVFGNVKAKTSADVLKNWEQLKATERTEAASGEGKRPAVGKGSAADSILGGVPRSLPAVLEAYQLTRRASHVGFDWDDIGGVLDKLDEEMREVRSVLPEKAGRGKDLSQEPRVEEEVGDLFFAAVNMARLLGMDPEIALKKANRKFKQRFIWMESAAAREGHHFADLPRDRMEELWNESKAHE